MKRLILFISCLVTILIFLSTVSIAQEYKIGTDDVLSVTFWQQPQFNTTVRVNQSGAIMLPVIGTIPAAGLTPTELATKIVDKISRYNRNISQASVEVTQYGSKTIYVTGHVATPGKYAFEVMPDLWKIILEAGGPSETAMLNRVKIIRSGQEAGKIIIVDLSEYLSGGDFSKLPQIYPGDTISIPGITPSVEGGGAPATGGVTATQVQEDVIYVYGQVVRPGGYRFTRNMNLLEAIIIAGGPSTSAKMDEVKVIIQGKHYSSVATVNLDQYANMGTPAPFLLNPGDTIFIPAQKGSWSRIFGSGSFLTNFLRVTLTAATTYYIYYLIQKKFQ